MGHSVQPALPSGRQHGRNALRIIGLSVLILSGTSSFADHVSFAAEALKIFTQRNAWAYYGLDESKDERQLQLSVRLRFGN